MYGVESFRLVASVRARSANVDRVANPCASIVTGWSTWPRTVTRLTRQPEKRCWRLSTSLKIVKRCIPVVVLVPYVQAPPAAVEEVAFRAMLWKWRKSYLGEEMRFIGT